MNCSCHSCHFAHADYHLGIYNVVIIYLEYCCSTGDAETVHTSLQLDLIYTNLDLNNHLLKKKKHFNFHMVERTAWTFLEEEEL